MKGLDEKEKGRSLGDEMRLAEPADEFSLEKDTFKLEEGRRTKGKKKAATEMARTEPGPLHPTCGSGLQKGPPAKQYFGRWGGRERREFLRITLGVRANLACMDDR